MEPIVLGVVLGMNQKLKGKKGNWITLAEWKFDDTKQRWVPVCVKSTHIDGEKIKEDTWYGSKKRRIVEVTP